MEAISVGWRLDWTSRCIVQFYNTTRRNATKRDVTVVRWRWLPTNLASIPDLVDPQPAPFIVTPF